MSKGSLLSPRRSTAFMRRSELSDAERLDEVIVGAELQADDAVDLLAPFAVTMMIGMS